MARRDAEPWSLNDSVRPQARVTLDMPRLYVASNVAQACRVGANEPRTAEDALRRIAQVAEDALASIEHRYGRFLEVSKQKHGIRQLPIEWTIELGSDLEWCIAEIRRLRREIERVQQQARPTA